MFFWSGIENDVRTYWRSGERFHIPNLTLEAAKIC